MVVAFVSVRVEPGMDGAVLSKVRTFKEVKEAISTYGMYDLLLKVEVGSLNDLDRFIFENLRKIPSVKETVTVIARG